MSAFHGIQDCRSIRGAVHCVPFDLRPSFGGGLTFTIAGSDIPPAQHHESR
jgi:hypothetical protein